ncbi:unnamed protein product [Symbiodinium natans]|uniref:Uncharacterized protein n=1 Tax=Symbiodinium natans TaxID=878477 RepID=A0A812T344_9DINO|nr:unnamed protein product [Symbiodinium natans]
MAVHAWYHLPSVATWLRTEAVAPAAVAEHRFQSTSNAVAEVLSCASSEPHVSQASLEAAELVTFAAIPASQRSPAMAPAVRSAKQHHRKAMERSKVYRKQVVTKSWSPSASLPVLYEGMAELENRVDGYASDALAADQTRHESVLETPLASRAAQLSLSALPGIQKQHPSISRPPPPPRGIMPCPPCDPPHHAMRQRSAQVRRQMKQVSMATLVNSSTISQRKEVLTFWLDEVSPHSSQAHARSPSLTGTGGWPPHARSGLLVCAA